MDKQGRCRAELPRQGPSSGPLAFLTRAFRGSRCTSREGPEGNCPMLDDRSSTHGLLGKTIAIGAALGGAGLVPGIAVSGAEITGGMDVAMELALESEDDGVVSIDVVETEELKSEREEKPELATIETNEDMLIEDGEVPPEIVAASLSLSASESAMASEAELAALSEVEEEAASASEAAFEIGSVSVMVSEPIAPQPTPAPEYSVADMREEEEVYYEEIFEEEDFWEASSDILEDFFEDFLVTETDEEDVTEDSEAIGLEEALASEQASMAASENLSMFTSIAVAASELTEEGYLNATRLESQYGLRDFTALANAMANENDSVRKSLNATIQQSEGDSEQMASILDTRSEKEDVLTSESMRAFERLAAMREKALAFSRMDQEANGGFDSPSELM